MDEWVSNLTESLRSIFSQEDVIKRVVEVIEDLGVCSAEDLKYVVADDLAGVLRPVETRKVIAYFKKIGMSNDSSSQASTLFEESSIGEDSFISDIDETVTSDNSTAASSSGLVMSMRCQVSPNVPGQASPIVPIQASPIVPIQTSPIIPSQASHIVPSQASFSSESGYSPNNSWHYNFIIPWSKLPSSTRQTLDNAQRPSAAERREVIRIVAAEVLTICKKPGKRHLVEIARQMVIRYPKSFRDEIEGQVVGAGFDSLVKQLMSRIDNIRRLQTPLAKRRSSVSGSAENVKKARKDAYGCINPDPNLPTEGDRRSLMEWPFLFQETGMRLHFRELTGIQIDDTFEESTATKFRRILRYFQFVQTDPSSQVGTILSQTLDGSDESCAAVLILLAHFKEQQDKLFVNVDDTAISTDVDTSKLPWTPCIVVCGNSPLTAKMFMVAVDQFIVNDQLSSFNSAFRMMFCSYYLHNIDYPVEIASTLEFLQRCIFKINPDRGTKVTRKEKGRQYAVNPRVLSLISKIANYELDRINAVMNSFLFLDAP
ncbi:hypothetical protein QQF64_022430 [Cirrhinus molitorella]|uniref:Uncharacterized protein n=1 Tax=Cirrhinus molitorella TaxID=172907 RepID=A0ABR3L8E1_9TELE